MFIQSRKGRGSMEPSTKIGNKSGKSLKSSSSEIRLRELLEAFRALELAIRTKFDNCTSYPTLVQS